MYLKRLQISGFKSFADSCKLDFEAGLTAIVGPNGCGKSNIIDAIRWCLGEMSVKSLRSSQMLDVIFNGSGSRPTHNMAEVTLTFDNSDKKLPIDYTEVAVSRRLFRSGESEYFINKTQCRLRDIKELFLDTGMGEDGYSSIEQGKVEWVLQAKPEERRELFEEAAGVAKYRARREESLRKLDRVEIDLSRLSDIINITTDQIRKLEAAVTRAKTYERIKIELKALELSDWLAQYEKIENDLKGNQAELESMSKKSEELIAQTHQQEANQQEYRRRMVELEGNLLKASGILAAIETDIKIGEERIQNAKGREEQMQLQMKQSHETISREKSRSVELAAQEEQQAEQCEQFKASGQSISEAFKQAEGDYALNLKNLEVKKHEIKIARDRLLGLAQDKARLQQHLSRLTSDTHRLHLQTQNDEKETIRVQRERESLESKTKDLIQQTEACKFQVVAKEPDLKRINQKLSASLEKQKMIQTQLLKHIEQAARLKGQIQTTNEQETRNPYVAGTKALQASSHLGIHGPLGRLIECAEHDKDLLASALGEQLNDMVADTFEDAKRAVDYLLNSNKGRARIWILDKLPAPFAKTVGELPKGDTLLDRIKSENKFQPLLAYLLSHTWIQGSSLFGHAMINGGVNLSQWQSHISFRLPELESTLAQLEKGRVDLEQELATLEAQLATLNNEQELIEKENGKNSIRLQLVDDEIHNNNNRLSLFAEEDSALDQELKDLTERIKKIKVEIEMSQGEYNHVEQEEKTLMGNLEHIQQELSDLQTSHSEAHANLSLKGEQMNSYQEKLNWHTSVLEHTRQEKRALETNHQHHQDNLITMKKELEWAKTTQGESKLAIQQALEKRTSAFDDCSTLQTKRAKLQAQIEDLEAAIAELRQELSRHQENIQEKRIIDASFHNKTELLLQKMKDQYEIDLAEARKTIKPQLADPETLEKLKKRMANIGPLNLAAPQEHAELAEKNSFLTSQRDDLLKAKEDLREVIQKINTTTREHFRETFERVRTNFKNLYGQLFQGGEADLRLADEGDILTAGVDIYCQPPGKKLLHISLLSGGEKALTACALLFAFFQVRPSPISLLDEVDAPLDEANVLRYVEMLKMFSQQTQFLIITHNKRTMEIADTLYGVTMEELGVSKIISARLAKEKIEDESHVEPEPSLV